MDGESYCLLTACKNEAGFIGKTIRSVIGQSLRPQRWVILDDGSTDGTAELIERLSMGHTWIKLERLGPRRERNFGAQYRAIMRGYEMIRHLSFDFVGALDADITFESADYFKSLMNEFRVDARLGVAGGVICENENGVFKERKGNVSWSVAGGAQMFRREVFEAIGGYTPLEYGATDALAVLMAEMKGWEVRSLPGLKVLHHRPTCAADGRLRGAFRQGLMDAGYGYPLMFAILKYVRRLTFKPYVVGSVLSFAGYCYLRLKGGRSVIPDEALEYLRKVQLERISKAIRLKRS